jgi:Arc/MetJ-type ribon-helix-helix transcriptional regulator
MDGSKTKIVATRVTLSLDELIEEYCKRDAHVNRADFVRDAIREKLQREVPELYSKLFQEPPQHV